MMRARREGELSRRNNWGPSFLLGTALRPAVAVQEVTVTALPGEFLAADLHVLREGSVGTVVVLLDEHVLADPEDHDGAANEDGDLDPRPEFLPLLGVGLVGLGRHQFLLVGDPRPDLVDGLALHLGFGSQPGDGLDGPASGCGGGSSSEAASHQVAGNVSGSKRLRCARWPRRSRRTGGRMKAKERTNE
jgi:hypothetical protein